MATQSSHRGIAALRVPEIRWAFLGVAFFTFASRAMAVVIAFQIYQRTQSALALGWLGLAEAIPAICTAPFGGFVADHYNRQRVIKITRVVCFFCSLVLVILSWETGAYSVVWFYLVILLFGFSRGFSDPAMTGFEAQIVPKELIVNAASWSGSAWISCSIVGPAAIGFVFEGYGAAVSYGVIALCFLLSYLSFLPIPPQKQIMPEKLEPVFESIRIGWRALWNIKPLLGSMVLDLVAVFFGGVMILLPVYASDILKTGASGLGLLNAAPSVGALIVTLIAAAYPPNGKAGRNLLLVVTGFGLSIIVFALSRSMWLSLTMLFLSGFFDGISMIIRRTMIRLLSPDHLRGRIAAANSIFISGSNELGAFESGMLAALIGPVYCAAVGGFVTLFVVGFAAKYSKELRELEL